MTQPPQDPSADAPHPLLHDPGLPTRALGPGELLLEQGDASHHAYVLLEGALEVVQGREVLAVLDEPGQVVGELGLFMSSPRTSTVRAIHPTTVRVVNRMRFTLALNANPAYRDGLQAAARSRLADLRALSALRHCPALHPESRARLRSLARWRNVAAGEVLVSAGDPMGVWQLVVSGSLSPTSGHDQSARVRGDLVGAAEALAGEPMARTWVADKDTEVLAWNRAHLESCVASDVHALRTLSAALLSPSRRGRAQTARVVAVFRGLSGRGLPPALVASLEDLDLGPVERVGLEQAEEFLGLSLAGRSADDVAWTRLDLWLEQERDSGGVLLLEADHAADEWGAWARRSADEHLLVVRGVDPPTVEPPMLPGALLVRVHPDTAQLPTNTASWFAATGTTRVSHVRLGSPPSLGRLSRRLVGQQVALVLCGGGALGLAHLGVIRALVDEGVPIDTIWATSLGGLLAAELARQDSPEQTLACLDELVSVEHAGKGPGNTGVLMDESQRSARTREVWQDTALEDLWAPTFLVASSLESSRAVVLERGPASTAVLATSALPGVFSPVRDDDDWLVDGGLLDSYPVAEARRRLGPEAVVIGVRFTHGGEEAGAAPKVRKKAGLLDRVFRRRDPDGALPLTETLTRSLQAAATRASRPELGLDLEILVDLTTLSATDFDRQHELMERGLAAAQAAFATAETQEALGRLLRHSLRRT